MRNGFRNERWEPSHLSGKFRGVATQTVFLRTFMLFGAIFILLLPSCARKTKEKSLGRENGKGREGTGLLHFYASERLKPFLLAESRRNYRQTNLLFPKFVKECDRLSSL